MAPFGAVDDGHLYRFLLPVNTLSGPQCTCSVLRVDRCERWAFGADRCLGVGLGVGIEMEHQGGW